MNKTQFKRVSKVVIPATGLWNDWHQVQFLCNKLLLAHFWRRYTA